MPQKRVKTVDNEDLGLDVSAKARDRFERTVREMLAMPAKPQVEMKMGAARKRDARSSGEGSAGKLGGTR